MQWSLFSGCKRERAVTVSDDWVYQVVDATFRTFFNTFKLASIRVRLLAAKALLKLVRNYLEQLEEELNG